MGRESEPSFRNLSNALERIAKFLDHLPSGGLEERLEAERRESYRAVEFLSGAVSEFFTERTPPGIGGRGADDLFALGEIDKKPTGSRSFEPPPIFIIGSWRSGTTLLSWLLDSHPRIAGVPENHLCLSLLATASVSLGPHRNPAPLLVWGYQSLGGMDEDRARYFTRFGEVIDGVFGDYARRRGKQRWVSKEIFLFRSLDLLDLVFDYRARFVYITRHGLDAAFSASERFGSRDGAPMVGRSSLDIESWLREWVAQNELCMDFSERNPERCLRMRYEDFVVDPERVGREIFSFLGESWPETILDDMRTQDHHDGLGDNKIFETGGRIDPDRRDRWRSLPPALLRQLGRIADPTLRRLGYPPSGEPV